MKIISQPDIKIYFKKNYKKEFKSLDNLKFQLKEIKEQYIKDGYLLAGYDSIITDSILTKAYFNPGKQFMWGEISFNPETETVFANARIRMRRYFNEKVLLDDYYDFNENVINYYENSGYPFIRTGLKNVIIKNDSVFAELYIDKQKRITIDSIIVRGGCEISKSYFNKYLSINNGSVYDESKIRNIDKKIDDIVFVKAIKPMEIIFKKDKATISLFLNDKKSNQFNGILGIIPNDKTSGKLLLTGNLNLRLLNSFKAGEIISFNWEKLETSSQNLNILFTLPYIYRQIGYNGALDLYKKDSSYVSVNIDNGITFSFNGSNFIKVFYKNKSSTIITIEGLESLTVLPDYADYTTNLYGLGFFYRKFDYRFNPRKGYSLYFDLASGIKNIHRNSKIDDSLYDNIELENNQLEGKIKANIYLALSEKIILKLENNSGYISSSTLFENELYRIGGLNILRGFDEKSINASAYSIISFEPRFVFEKNSSLYTFFDFGFYETDVMEYTRDNPMGLGVGLDFETNAGIFTINYAIGKQFDNSFEIRSAKIHFGYINRF